LSDNDFSGSPAPNTDIISAQHFWTGAAPPSQPRQFALTIAVRSWWLCGLRKEEHKESGIILDLTRCGQRPNNRAAILQSKIT
jgi:hypothetical protein